MLRTEGITQEFEIGKGVRPDDGLLATLFNINIEGVIEPTGIKGTLRETASLFVAYVNDVAIIAKNENNYLQAMQKIHQRYRREDFKKIKTRQNT